MINVSREFLELLRTERAFTFSAKVTLTNGTVINLTEDDLELGQCSIVCALDSGEFLVGNAVSQQLNLAFFNPQDKYKNYNFFGAVIIPKLIFWLTEETSEAIQFNAFTVTEPEIYGTTINLVAYDAMYKTDAEFEAGTLAYPTTALQFLQYCCQRCGLLLMTQSFSNSDYQIKVPPSGVSFRQCIGYVAMLAGGNAVIRDGGIALLPYNSALLSRPSLDGGYFGDEGTSYTSGDIADGGSFNPWTVGEDLADVPFQGYEAHSFTEAYQGMTISTDDVVITGISVTGEVTTSSKIVDEDGQAETVTETEERTFTSGVEGYVLSVENALLTNNWQDGVDRIGAELIGLRFRPFDVTIPSYPLAEIGDNCYLSDYYGVQHLSFVTEMEFNFHNSTTLKCTASDPVRNMARYYTNSVAIQAIKAARKVTNEIMPLYDIEAQRMTGIVANALGFYTTREVQDDGSTIAYIHNRVSLENSDIIWKRTSQGFVVSTDYGETWNAGIDANGNATLNLLSVKGIRWDWARGGTLTLGGFDNKSGIATLKDEEGETVGRWNNKGLSTVNGSKETRIRAGGITFYREGEKTGEISPSHFAGSVGSGITFAVENSYFSFSTFQGETLYTQLMINNGLNPSGRIEKVLFNGSARLTGSTYIPKNQGIRWGDASEYSAFYYGITNNRFVAQGSLFADGNLSCSGTKNRIVNTKDYGDVKLYAFETPNCHFADVGSATIGENGEVYVYFDPVYEETIDTKAEYQVLVTRTSPERTDWVEKHPGYFIAHGEPGATFDWMIIGYQRDYTATRLESDPGDEKLSDDGESLYNDSNADFTAVQKAYEEDKSYITALHALDEMLSQFNQEVTLL